MRYTLCIKFYSNKSFIWDIKEDFKSMQEVEPFIDMVDETCERAILIDNVTGKYTELT